MHFNVSCLAKGKNVFVNDLRNKYKSIDALNKAWGSKYSDWESILNSTDIPLTPTKRLGLFFRKSNRRLL
ncbi:MAG: beta-galactosidase [Bacilli bacterium]